ncbi:MAG: hypothetical protein ABSC51_03925 [Gaiellaceae bacterium]|jgi:hypothetical protein
MARRTFLFAAVIAAVCIPATAAASRTCWDPGSQYSEPGPVSLVKADIDQLQADFAAAHDTLMADAQTLQTDAALLTGSDIAAAQATIKADFQKLRSDFRAERATIRADWRQLRSDYYAARRTHLTRAERHELSRDMTRLMVTLWRGNAQLHEAIMAAQRAIRTARLNSAPISPGDASGISDSGMGAPSATTPDVTIVTADITQLQADFTTAQNTLLADASTLRSDARLLAWHGRMHARAIVRADFQKLRSDFQAEQATIHSDWQQFRSDYLAARAAGLSADDQQELRGEIAQLMGALWQGNAQVHRAIMAAQMAIRMARWYGAPISWRDESSISNSSMDAPSGASQYVTAMTADGAQLRSDLGAGHDALIADASRLQAHTALLSRGEGGARTMIKGDFQKLHSDFQATQQRIHADWNQLRSDYLGAHNARLSAGDLYLLRQAVSQLGITLRTGRARVHAAISADGQAIRNARHHGGPISSSQENGISDSGMNVPASL